MSVPRLHSIVAGEPRGGGGDFDDLNPSRPTDVVATVDGADEAVVDSAVDAANEAARDWRRMPAPARCDLMHRVADLLVARAEEIGHDMAREEGKTLPEAVGEVRGSAAQFRYAAGRGLEPDGSTVAARDPSINMLWARREPLGTVACITPWNFPISIPAWKLAHALVSGNTVVWKPAELTPLTSTHLARCIADAGVPSGVMNMLLGDGITAGAPLVRHAGVDGVSFTGSTAVGSNIARSIDPVSTRLQLEMGGSNPVIVLPDADLELASREIAQGAFSSSGQKCTATARVIASSEIVDELSDRLVAEARSWRTGDALDSATDYGPVASARQYRHVADRLAAADRSAFASGGVPRELDDGAGYFIDPTILTGIDEHDPLVTEEIFGPVTVVLRAQHVDDAIRLANASSFGLTASIFSNDLASALRFADEAEFGVVKINKATTGNEIHVPFGGRKNSGAGPPEMGWATWDFYTQWKTVYVSAPLS